MRFAPPLNLADPAWLSMRCSLWPESPATEHLCDMADTLARGHRVLLAQDEAGTAVGFVEASIRNDYVNGTETSPVAFIEGLYVEPAQRRRGVGRALIAEIAVWGRARGCWSSRPIRRSTTSRRTPSTARSALPKPSVSSAFANR